MKNKKNSSKSIKKGTTRKQTKKALRQLEDELFRLNRVLKALSNSNQAILQIKSEKSYVDEVCRIVTEDCGYQMVWIGFAEDDENKTVNPIGFAGFEKEYVDSLKITWTDTPRGRGPTGTAIRTGETIICKDMLTDPKFVPWRKEALKRGYTSSISLPLKNDKTFGVMNVYSIKPDAFSEEEVKILTELANDLAKGLLTIRISLALHDSEIRFRRLFEAAKDGILILNANTGQIDEVNPYLIKMLDYSRDEFLGKKIWEIGAFVNVTKSKKAFRELQIKGQVRYEDLPLKAKDGHLVQVEFVSNVYNADHIKVIQCNIRDITERKKEEYIEEQKKLLNQEKLKTEFIADVTHELRTPLAVIRGNVDLVLLNGLNNKKLIKESLININHEIVHMAGLIGNLVTLSTGNIKKHIENVTKVKEIDLSVLIHHVVKKIQKVAYIKNITLSFKKFDKVEIMGNEKLIEELFANLIKNAIHYGKENGYIKIVSHKENDIIKISIKDNGIGIPKKDLSNIFERFFRTEISRKYKKEGGTGLGLAIVKKIIKDLGGSINVTSIVGKGSTFTVSLPINK